MRLSWLVASSDAPVLLLCLFMWLPEWIPKQIEEKIAPLLCFSCVNHHIVCMITHQYQICTIYQFAKRKDVGENNTTFSVIQRTKEGLGILRKVYLSPRLGGAWCSSWTRSWGPASQQPCQSPVINCRSPHKYTNSSTTPNHHSVSCNWSPGSVLDRCWLRFVLALFMSSFICCMLCSVDCLILLPFPLPLAAATLLHHCVGPAYEIIVNQALVL